MIRRRIQGLAFVLVIVTLLGLAIAKYNGAFESGVPVTLQVDRAGNQLTERSDVKMRGLIVGSVETISTTGGGADVELTIRPDMVDLIPAGVSARLLPKTLFGEKYVSLVAPASGGGGTTIAAGDVIPMDRSETAREIDAALDGLLPLLQAVNPDDLATTLGALSQALSGRGERLGDTLVRLQELTGGLRPGIPDLQEDITQFADFADNLDSAAPDLLDALEDFSATSRTVVEQRDQLRALIGGVTTASDDLSGFLDRNGENIISLSAASRPTLESLARYSPEFPCFFEQLNGLVPRLDEVFGVGRGRPGVYVTVEIVNNKGKYVPNQDEPEYLDDRGPRCYPILPLGPQEPPDGPFCDGSLAPPPPVDSPRGDVDALGGDTFGTGDASYTCEDGSSARGTPASGGGALLPGLPVLSDLPVEAIAYQGMGLPNSPGEQRLVAELVAAQDGGSPADVPGWGSMMVGPLYRGSEVTLT
ncbi:MCE family protein [Pseudonocardia sp. KRD-184]|uniref:MCE family protein n=2 Tax=Pseudonocardia oceani TaxID=2792013 RepID=A0ABS6U6Z7_9PSEU|nr:MCE family protein [Pseudonocardia oceani]MBW0090844.1 MCE family protein [Pseudonocardia oceani]MBW0094574.1 MCE family protein [Pseudonocardia oceani]MBW0120535.1 MCE family protein [Pseudonocardia oceani]MBW0128012.1 MCE family protein [Pseudonocardia oceani]